MDKSKFKKPSHNKSRVRATMDGFVGPDSFKRTGSIGFPDKKDFADGKMATKLDDFRRVEGFSSSAQSIDGNSQAEAVSRPVVPLPAPLLNSGPRKNSKFGRNNKGRRLSTGMKPRRSWIKIIKRSILAIVLIVFVTGIYFGFKLYIVEKNIFKGGGNAPGLAKKVDITKLKGEGDGRVNILLLGIGGPGHEAPDLSDTIMLISIDPVNNQATMLSIPRDLWVEIPGYGSQKINAAFSYGKQNSKEKSDSGKTKDGIALAEKTLASVLNVPIHYHVVVDFAAFRQAIDAVGGVTFDVPEQLYDPTIAWENGNKSVIAAKGVQTFNGARALLYARSRETSSDFARAERQRQLIVALKEKILSAGTYSNPIKISQLLSTFGNNIYTDIDSGDIPRLYQIGSMIPSSSILSLDMVTPPHSLLTTGAHNGLSVVMPRAGLYQYEDIQNYVRNALVDGFIFQENASIAILNGTNTIGVASLKSKELKSYGYNVVSVGDAPTKDYQKTVFVDLSKGTKKYTVNYLEKRLGVKAVTTLPAGITAVTTDFVIILGSNTTGSSSTP